MNNNNSYRTIIKSTSLVGGGQIVKIIFNIIRNKFIALILGTSGIGLVSTFNATMEIICKVFSLGIDASAVREIAKNNNGNESEYFYKTIFTLRRLSVLLGLAGTLFCILFADKISIITFESREYISEIRLLSVVIFFYLVSGSQMALLQGKRMIRELVKANLYTSIIGSLVCIPIIYYFTFDGIVYYLIILALVQLISSWWYAKKIKIERFLINFKDFFNKSKEMLKLGLSIMLSAMINLFSFYFIRIIIIRYLDIQSVGLYQASFAISSLYVVVILDAMGKDFYPRLVSSINNQDESIRIINEQTYIGILLFAPIIILILALSPYIINIFYSSEFNTAYQILRWQIFGVFLQVVCWPLGYYLIAKGYGKLYFITQLIFVLLNIILNIFFIMYLGIIGTGVAFLFLYILSTLLMLVISRKIFNFKWSIQIIKYLIFFSSVFVLSFLALWFFPIRIVSIIISVIGLLILYYNIIKLLSAIKVNNLKELFKILFLKLKKSE